MKGILMGKQKEQTVQTAQPAPQPARMGALAEARAALQVEQNKLESIRAQIREARQMTGHDGITAAQIMQANAAHNVLGQLTIAENHAKGLCRLREEDIERLELNRKHAQANYDEAVNLLRLWPASSAATLAQMRDNLSALSREIYNADPLAALTMNEAVLKLASVCARWSELQARLDGARRNLERLGD